MKPPPKLKRQGVIRRSEFAAYLAALAPHLGFRLESPSFDSVRDSVNGLHIRRRRAPGPPSEIKLELELQYRWCEVFYCILGVDGESAYTTSTQVAHYDNGDITTTTEQTDVGPHYVTATESRHTCASPDISDDEDAGFDYGDFVSSDPPTFGGTVDAGDLLALALAGLVNDGSPYVAETQTWMSDLDPPTGVFDFNLGSWNDVGSPYDTRKVNSFRYRWKATGADLDLAWDQGGSSFTTTVAAGGSSGWYDDVIPATIDTPDTISSVVIALA